MFWIIIAVFVLVSLVFIVYPLLATNKKATVLSRADANRALYHSKVEELQFDLEKGLLDQEEYDDSVADLQRALLTDIESEEKRELRSGKNFGLVATVVIALPVAAVLMYQQFSTADKQAQASPQQAQQAAQIKSLEESVSNLEQRLLDQPNNIEGWQMLGQSYFVLQKYQKAIGAYSKASELAEHKNPTLMVLMAEASAFANNELFGDYENRLLDSALQINPRHERALWYSGYAAYKNGEFNDAAKHWEVLLELVPTDRPDVKSNLLKFLNDARQKSGQEIIVAEASVPSGATVPAGENSAEGKRLITVSVELSEQLKGSVNPEDTLFIYARAAQGPKMPLSLSRFTVADIPVTVTLTEDMAMLQNMTMASFDQVHAVARISKSGQAITQPGDFIAQGVLVDFAKSASAEVSLRIDTIVE